MAFQLDDLLKEDKKDTNLIPDLSKATCNSKEEFRRLFEHCPEFRTKAEKVKREDIKVRDKDFSWKTTKKELRTLEKPWAYGNPIPPEMRSMNLRDLQDVDIHWKMLTQIRPEVLQDEEMFSRLVEMCKLEGKTVAKERRLMLSPIRRSKNRAGIIESSVKSCGECGEEFCFGESCGDILYDSFIRVTITTQQAKPKISANVETIIAKMGPTCKKGKKKKKSSRKTKKIQKSHTHKSESKSSSNRNENAGDENMKTIKPFKRKCSKYRKKHFVHA